MEAIPSKTAEGVSIKVKDEPANNVVTFSVKGKLDVSTYLELKNAMDPYLPAAAGRTWLVDLSDVAFVASSGWSVFIATRQRLKRVNGQVCLVGLSQGLLSVFDAMNLREMIPVFATLGEARKQLGSLAAQG